jgi:hypothetical protein
MIRSITVTNYLDESITLELRAPEKSGLLIQEITGLNPPKADINTTELSTMDGSQFTAARITSRFINITLKILDDVETNRRKTYRYFPIKKRLKLSIETDIRTYETYGYVESNEASIFSPSVATTISINCPDPWLYSTEDGGLTTTLFSGIEDGFEFPFSSEITTWVEVAPTLGVEAYIYSLVIFNNKIYGGTAATGKLYEWNGTNAWVEVAPTLGSATHIYSLVVYNGKIYGSTHPNGCLYEWNGTNAWIEVAPQLGSETSIVSLIEFNNKLYGGTYPNSKLYEWNGVDAWVEVAPKYGVESHIFCLNILNNKLYGGTYPNGKLYEWNGVDAWVQVASQLNSDKGIMSLAILNNKLYGGTYTYGGLYEWNGTNAWVQVAPPLSAETRIYSLLVLDGILYGGTYPNGKLYKWNGTNAWVEVSPKLGSVSMILSLINYHGHIYGGTYSGGRLYRTKINDLEFGTLLLNQEQNIYYEGDSEIGITIFIHSIGEVQNLTFYNTLTNVSMTIDTDKLNALTGNYIIDGDDIIISTVKGNKYITLIRDGLYINIINCLGKNIAWLTLNVGDNPISFYADSGVENLEVTITNKTIYEGV